MLNTSHFFCQSYICNWISLNRNYFAMPCHAMVSFIMLAYLRSEIELLCDFNWWTDKSSLSAVKPANISTLPENENSSFTEFPAWNKICILNSISGGIKIIQFQCNELVGISCTLCHCKYTFIQYYKRIFSLNRPLGRFSHRVALSVCLSVCLSVTP